MGTHFDGTAEEVTAANAFVNLIRSSESILARLNQKRTIGPLSLSQFMTMDALLFLGPLSQNVLGKKILKTSGNITMVVDNLEEQSLVRREKNPTDRRSVTVYLTEKGTELISELVPMRVKAVTEEMSILTGEEQVELRRLCRILGTGERDEVTSGKLTS
mgnify:CR=1 FL=1|jgi:MarR family 2-MHQ and catechol resistance regulon transcriptional repressor|tara:strand:- start:1906 stop:2385 length:480 start_codon:yes stop_codon:yes gene_type:complete